ncbi:response regulator [Lysobacter hankyongensis]|uniref:Response regulatory domain-containing protein n=1 Tax=Lysobacter hankyongensis TaxID=1176535 RepID=A0ABP9BJE8_9GAMM
MWRILCVEDDEAVALNLVDFFSEWYDDNPFGADGIEVVIERSFESAIRRLKNEHFDLVTLDLHGTGDPDPLSTAGDNADQEGMRVLKSLREVRFLPVIFYTGFAERIKSIETGVVRVVKKGEDDPQGLRSAARKIYDTGLPRLLRQIDSEKREYMWDTVDRYWSDVGAESAESDLAYLLARRLAARFNRDSVKELLGHKPGAARPVEMYIYPPIDRKIKTGCIFKDEGGSHWVVVTPACDFAQANAEHVLLVGADDLANEKRFIAWQATAKWKGVGEPPSKPDGAAWNKLTALMRNNGGDRWRFLPGTFFLPNLVVDIQKLNQLPLADMERKKVICQLDSPYIEELMLHFSRYYGRIGTPDLDPTELVEKLA